MTTTSLYIFATDGNIKLLAEAETIYVDGTFRTSPALFYQIFTVHAFKNGQQHPLAYCPLPDKTRASYQRAFDLLIEKAQVFDLSFTPSQVMSDFKLVIIQAA